jgi:hypothetical protein
LAVVVALGAGLAMMSDLSEMWVRLRMVPDMWLAVLGSALTALLATVAAFQTSIPGRAPGWALLPLPGLLLWLGASGLGCLRSWVLPGTSMPSLYEERSCVIFIVCVSLPLSLLMMAMLSRAYPLRPRLTAGLGGLAAASAAATLLVLFHPYDVALTDILMHAVAVVIVIALSRAFGGRFLGGGR